MSARVTRRELIRAGAGAAAAAWMAPRAASGGVAPTIVVIVLRGGADGFSLLVPYREEAYYRARPRIAIPPPPATPDAEGAPGASIALDERFALHPRLARWKPLFERRELGAVVGVGLPARIPSHRDAQRALDAVLVRAAGGPAQDVLRGPLAEQLRRVAATLEPTAPRIVWLESHGWDTHTAQGTATRGRLATAIDELATALLAFHAAAGPHFSSVRGAIVTEFGRTLAETPTHGTDDAHASVLITFGGNQSGRVLGSYASFEPLPPCQDRRRPPTGDLESALTRCLRGE